MSDNVQVRPDEYFENAFVYSAIPSEQIMKDFNASKRNKGDKIPLADVEGIDILAANAEIGVYDSAKVPADYTLFNVLKTQKFLVQEVTGFVASAAWGNLSVTTEDLRSNSVVFLHEAGGVWHKILTPLAQGEKIDIWEPKAYHTKEKAHKDGLFYEATENTLATDVPGIATKWKNISNPVKTIELRRYATGEVALDASGEQFVAVRNVEVGENLNSPDAFKKISLTSTNTYTFSGKFKNN